MVLLLAIAYTFAPLVFIAYYWQMFYPHPSFPSFEKVEIQKERGGGLRVVALKDFKAGRKEEIFNIRWNETVVGARNCSLSLEEFPWATEEERDDLLTHYESLLALGEKCYLGEELYFRTLLPRYELQFDIHALSAEEVFLFSYLGQEEFRRVNLERDMLWFWLGKRGPSRMSLLKRCWGLVRSRAFSFSGVNILIPYMDLLNHDSEAQWLVEKNEEGGYRMSVQKSPRENYRTGEEVFGHYGPKTNAELLIGYGFVPKENIFNEFLGGPDPVKQQRIRGLLARGPLSNWQLQKLLETYV